MKTNLYNELTKEGLKEIIQSYVNDSLKSIKTSHEAAKHSPYVRAIMFFSGLKFKYLSKENLEDSAKEFESFAKEYIQGSLGLPQNYFD